MIGVRASACLGPGVGLRHASAGPIGISAGLGYKERVIRKLLGKKPVQFDPIVEAKRVFKALGIEPLSSEAYVFGSAARGDFHESSDIDVLVIFDSPEALREARMMLTQRPVSEWPFDWVLKLRADFDKRSEIGGVCYLAKREGVRIK